MFLLKDFYFPDNVGMPIGEPDDDATYIMEVHYNNPELRSGKHSLGRFVFLREIQNLNQCYSYSLLKKQTSI